MGTSKYSPVSLLLVYSLSSLAVSCSSPTSPPSEGERFIASEGEAIVSAPASTFTLTIAAPAALSPIASVLEATNSLDVGLAGQVVSGSVSAMGSAGGGSHFEAGASLNDAWSRGPATVDIGAAVHGTLHATTPVVGFGASVSIYDKHPRLDPSSTLTWNVVFPAAPTPAVSLASNTAQSILPGRYGNVAIAPGATLTLQAGTYYFFGLEMAPLSSMKIDQTNGPVVIYVSDVLELGGAITSTTGADPDLFISFFGVVPVLVGGPTLNPFKGSLVAPSALLTLLASKGTHAGFFAARDIILGAGAKVQYVPPYAIVGAANPDPEPCSKLIPPPPGSGPAVDAAYQTLIARYCTMPGTPQCIASLVGKANVDYTTAAQKVLSGAFTPAQYLAISRDRTRKLHHAETDSAFAAALCNGKDGDGDWVVDPNDHCPTTPELTATDDVGCTTALPPGPDPGSVTKVLNGGGILYNPRCAGAAPPAEVAGAALYQTANPAAGQWVAASRVTNQPAGCEVWYLFEIRPLLHGAPVGSPFSVAFLDKEATSPVAGIPGLPAVPPNVIQFLAKPGDPGTRGALGSLSASPMRANFRVQAINGNGARGPWSPWKLTSQQDCHALGITCAIKN